MYSMENDILEIKPELNQCALLFQVKVILIVLVVACVFCCQYRNLSMMSIELSIGSTHFWPITIHLQPVVSATIFNWTQWNISQATKILSAFSLKSIECVVSLNKTLQNILVFSIITWFDVFWDQKYWNQVSKYIFIYTDVWPPWVAKCAESE